MKLTPTPSTTSSALVCALVLGCALLAACGGDEEGAAPTIQDVQITCGPGPGGAVDVPVVVKVSAQVDDADRDLTGVTGTLNGLNMETLTGATDSTRHEWTPPADWEPLACAGTFAVTLTATDQSGLTTTVTERVTGGS